MELFDLIVALLSVIILFGSVVTIAACVQWRRILIRDTGHGRRAIEKTNKFITLLEKIATT